jgi:SPP1 family predicted phage head-tail adaptor
MIVVGSLNKMITIQENTVAKDAGGMSKTVWTDYISVWASKYVRTGQMKDGEHSSRVEENVEWTTWYREDINYNMRIKYENQYYRIEFIDELGDKEGLRIVTNVIKQGV